MNPLTQARRMPRISTSMASALPLTGASMFSTLKHSMRRENLRALGMTNLRRMRHTGALSSIQGRRNLI